MPMQPAPRGPDAPVNHAALFVLPNANPLLCVRLSPAPAGALLHRGTCPLHEPQQRCWRTRRRLQARKAVILAHLPLPDPSCSAARENDLSVEARTMAWVRVIVVGLGLCPFAQGAVDRARVRIVVSRAACESTLRTRLAKEIDLLCSSPRNHIETTLIVAPDFARNDFRQFHAFGEHVEAEIEADDRLVDSIMIARFHPEHEWGDAEGDNPVNFDKRAPYPILNILRADQVDEYIAQGRTADILENNMRTLERIGTEKLRELYRSLS